MKMIKGCEEIKKVLEKSFMATTISFSLLIVRIVKHFFALKTSWAGEVGKGNGKEKVCSSEILIWCLMVLYLCFN